MWVDLWQNDFDKESDGFAGIGYVGSQDKERFGYFFRWGETNHRLRRDAVAAIVATLEEDEMAPSDCNFESLRVAEKALRAVLRTAEGRRLVEKYNLCGPSSGQNNGI